jgi:hypothetical protein
MTNDIVARLRWYAGWQALASYFSDDLTEAADEIERLRADLNKSKPAWQKTSSIPSDRPVLVHTKHLVTIQVIPAPGGKLLEEWHGVEVNKHDLYAWREKITIDEIGELK